MALDKIIEKKILEVEERKNILPLKEIISYLNENNLPKRGFYNALKKSIDNDKPGLIAEIKFASPSRGVIRNDLTPEQVAEIYEKNEFVDCISVLTEKFFFGGDISYIERVKKTTSKPVLRKDFIIDEYQIYESAYYGADCILLIVSALPEYKIKKFLDIASNLDLDVLVELYDESDIMKIEKLNISLLGINSRNLRTLDVSLNRHQEILKKLPYYPDILIAESGIKTREDIVNAIKYGFNGFLIGESFMSSANIYEKINTFMEGIRLKIAN